MKTSKEMRKIGYELMHFDDLVAVVSEAHTVFNERASKNNWNVQRTTAANDYKQIVNKILFINQT